MVLSLNSTSVLAKPPQLQDNIYQVSRSSYYLEGRLAGLGGPVRLDIHPRLAFRAPPPPPPLRRQFALGGSWLLELP